MTSAPEHLGSTLRHKGASVRASLYAGQRGGGQLVPGWPRHPGATRRGALAILCAYPWEGAHWKKGVCAWGMRRGGKDGEEVAQTRVAAEWELSCS